MAQVVESGLGKFGLVEEAVKLMSNNCAVKRPAVFSRKHQAEVVAGALNLRDFRQRG